MNETIEKALAALNALCAERTWGEVSLRDVAQKADIPLTRLYSAAPSKTALIGHLVPRLDEATLATASTASEDVHDRLFDASMARIEAMEPWRAALAGIQGPAIAPLLPHLPKAARAILEAAGVEATAPRLAAMSLVWARVVQVWRADGGTLNRTMAEIDKRLKQMRARLNTIGQGF